MRRRRPRSSFLALPCGACLLALLVATAPASATSSAPPEPSSVRATGLSISKIVVEGLKHAPPELVVIASRLEEGKTYDETSIASAVAQIRRLPFVHHAEVSVTPGAERGHYNVVFTIRERQRFYVAADLELLELDQSLRFDPLDGPTDSELATDLAAGLRWFPGGKRVVTAGLNAGAFELGLTQYRLGGTPLAGSATVAHRPSASRRSFGLGLDPTLSTFRLESTTELNVSVGYPLADNQLVSASISTLTAGETLRGAVTGGAPLDSEDTRHHKAQLAWVLDTTDDPLFARRGRVIRAGLSASALETDSSSRLAVGSTVLDSQLVSAHLSLRQHWPLGRKSSASLALAGSIGRADVGSMIIDCQPVDVGDVEVTTGRIDLALTSNLWLPQVARRRGDLRWEARAGLARENLSPQIGVGAVDQFELSVGMVFRNQWGAIRLAFTYLDFVTEQPAIGGPT